MAPELTPQFLPQKAAPNILAIAEQEGSQGAQALLEVHLFVLSYLFHPLPPTYCDGGEKFCSWMWGTKFLPTL